MAHLRGSLSRFSHVVSKRSMNVKVEIGARKMVRCAFATHALGIELGQAKTNTARHDGFRKFHDDRTFKLDMDDEQQVASQLGATSSDGTQSLYDGHILTNSLQKGLLTVGSAVMSLYDPYRDDMIAVLGEVTGHSTLRRLQDKMLDDPEGRQILQERPRINTQTVDMDWLASLPPGTLGREYVDFMKRNKISSDTRSPVHFVDDADLAYVMQRYREIHDFNHALLNMPATMLGEVAVKWFEMFNTGLPMTTLGALFGPLRVKRRNVGKLFNVYIPWVVRTAPSAKLLLNVYFEKRWEQPLTELHQEIGIRPFTKDR